MGEHLDRARSVVFLDSELRGRVLESGYTAAALEFEISEGAAIGPHYFRIVSPRGPSSLMIFHVGDQPQRVEQEPNDRLSRAEVIPTPVTINARLDSEKDFDFYRFEARKGETWIFDLRAARNGNGLDAALILLDQRGAELRHVEDHFIWDPFFAHTFTSDGVYHLAVQPNRRINPYFAYQLDIRRPPHLATVSPIAFSPGETREATVFGAGITDPDAEVRFDAPGFEAEVIAVGGDEARLRLRVPANAPPGEYHLALQTAAGRSTPAAFLVDDTPRRVGGQELEIPTSVTGIIRYRRPESFFFRALAGETLAFEVRAHRHGSPVDALLRILDEEGGVIAENDDLKIPGIAYNKDPRILYRFQQSGRYELQLRNLSKTKGENFPYLLRVTPPEPHLELMAATDHPYVFAGGEGKLKVDVLRHDGFDGPVRLSVRGLPDGVRAETVVIAATEKSGEIIFRAECTNPGTNPGTNPCAEPGDWSQILVVAGEAARPAWRAVKIASGGGEGAAFADVTRLTLGVAEKSRFSLEAQLSSANLVRGGRVRIPMEVNRTDGFEEEITFWVENLPAEVTLEPVKASKDETSVTIHLCAGASVETRPYRRVVILGRSSSGEVQQAPKISVTID